MKRKVLIITMFFILLFSLSYVNAQEISNNTDMDDTLSSSQSSEILGNGLNFNDGGGSLKDLKGVVQSADIIALNNNYTYTDGDPTDGIEINGNKIIIGNNITIDGKNQARLFVFKSSQIYISGINFVNFKTNLNGAAIYSNGSSAVINNCTFENCQASNGGGLYYDGISLLIVNSTFKNNEANDDGGGAYISASSTIIVNSTFTSSKSKSGGGFYWKKTERTINLNNGFTQDPILGSVALGPGASASGWNSVAVGDSAIASGSRSIAVGNDALATIVDAIAVGNGASATGRYSVAVGTSASATNGDAIAVGRFARSLGSFSIAQGYKAFSSGENSVAVGVQSNSSGSRSVAVGDGAYSEGVRSVATGSYSYANDYGVSVGSRARAEGVNSIAIGGYLVDASGIRYTQALNDFSVALGVDAIAGGDYATAFGFKSKSDALNSIAMGKYSVSTGNDAMAFGTGSQSMGMNSIALGHGSTASGMNSIAIGNDAIADGENSIVIGSRGRIVYWVPNPILGSVALGPGASATGVNSVAVGDSAIASGSRSIAVGNDALATIVDAIAVGNGASATGRYSVAVGTSASATNGDAIAVGRFARSLGSFSIAQGYKAFSSGENSVAVGVQSNSSGSRSVAVGDGAYSEGVRSVATGSYSYANDYGVSVGSRARAEGVNSIAIGGYLVDASGIRYTQALNDFSVALGVDAIAGGDYATAFGFKSKSDALNSIAMGKYSVSTGNDAMAFGTGSQSMGMNSIALGHGSTASGMNSIAIGNDAIADGENSIVIGSRGRIVYWVPNPILGSVALGPGASATGVNSVAVGDSAIASGSRSIAVGNDALATIVDAIAVGNGASATGRYSVAVGTSASATNGDAIAVGRFARSLGSFSIAQGYKAFSSGENSVAVGVQSNSSGSRSVAVGDGAYSEGVRSVATGSYSYANDYGVSVGSRARAEGVNSIAIGGYLVDASGIRYTQALNDFSVALGVDAIAGGDYATAFGFKSKSDALNSIAMGKYSVSTGNDAMAFGTGSQSMGMNSIALGHGSTASGMNSIAIGNDAIADGENSIAIGNQAMANSQNSIALGYGTIANGINSYALGSKTTVEGDYSMAWGNEFYTINDNVFTVALDGSVKSQSSLAGSYSILKGQNNRLDNVVASTVVGNNYALSNMYGITAYNGLIASNGLIIVNSTFTSNKASNRGGSVYMGTDSKLLVYNSTFNSSSAGYGGAILGGYNVNIYNSTFENNIAFGRGGAIFMASLKNASQSNVYNSTFIKNSARERGGAIDAGYATKVFAVYDSDFRDNKIYEYTTSSSTGYGGALAYVDIIDNCDFIGNTAPNGGAVYQWDVHSQRLRINNSRFDNNSARWGGALLAHYSGSIVNTNFTNNVATGSGGAIGGWNAIVSNSSFINNTAVHGGAYSAEAGRVYDSLFINNNASANGGTIHGSLLIVTGNKIYNTAAANGGAIWCGNHGDTRYSDNISNNLIVNSTANAGGAIYVTARNIKTALNSNRIFNSSADVAGGIYTDSLTTMKDNIFDNVTASDIAGAIYNGYVLDLRNNKILSSDAALGKDIYNNLNISVSYLTFLNNDTLYSSYLNNVTVFATLTDDMGNTITCQNITFEINGKTCSMESVEGNGSFNYTVDFYGTEVVGGNYSGSTIANTVIKTGLINSVPAVLVINKTVADKKYYVGDIAEYTIKIVNNCTFTAVGVVVNDYLTSGLEFIKGSVSKGSYANGVWTIGDLNPNDEAKFVYYCTLTKESSINNTAVVSSKNSESKKSSAVINVLPHNPDIDVVKKALDSVVILGNHARFEFIINNTGNRDLFNVSITEDSFDGLEFAGYVESTLWNHSLVNGKHIWTLNEVLTPNRVVLLLVEFNTKDVGTFVNNAIVKSDKTGEELVNALVSVVKPEISVEKVALTPSVVLGNQAKFEIIVNNTGSANLFNVSITEDSFDGLEFAGYVESSLWSHSIVNGKHVWTLNNVLEPNRLVSLIVNFNTLNAGTFVNNAIVKSDKTGEELVNDFVTVVKPEISVKKIALTPNVVLGNQARFEIIVNNTGGIGLSDVKVYEDSFEGLVFDSYEASSRWNYSNVGNIPTWSFKEVLPAGEWVSLIVNFITTANGTFTNHVKVESNMSNADDSADVIVLKPEMTIEKVTLTPNVVLGENTEFEIVVHNNGQSDLTGIVIEELPDDALIYDSFKDNGLFKHSVISGVHTWTLDKLAAGNYAGLIVYYKTASVGSISNTIVVKSNEIEDKRAYNTTNVILPSFSVEKVALKPAVLTNNQTIFEVIVKNTGNATLHDVYIMEDSFDGLVFDSTFGDKIWNHTFDNGKNTWILNNPLYPNEFSVLFLRFNTTDVTGNLTNIVVAGSNETGFKYANATVQVFSGVVPEPPVTNSSNKTSFELFKSVVTQEILVNGQVTFQVVIHNNGDTNLEKVILTELAPEGLIYDSFTDYLDLWTYTGDLIWSANDVIYPGEYVGFFITFNATNEGKFSNAIEVTVNDTNVSYANVSFEVLKPDFAIEKVLVENNIANGNQATFEIVIHNTGKASLNNLTVKDLAPEGLIYDSFTDYLDLWTYNGDLTWTMSGSLVPGEYVAFFVVFNTTEVGDFTNVVVANSSECDNRYSQAVLSVLDVEFDISKVCLTPVTVLGNQVTFEITVQNTGKLNLSSLKLSEISFDGLIFDHYNDYLGHWIYNGDLTWNLAKTLVSREISSLFVVFNTTDVGNFTNLVLGEIPEDTNGLLAANGDANSKSKFAQASVEVVKPEYVIEKIAINKTAVVGQQVLFEIIVKNIGKVAVEGIVISESEIEGLVFDHFIDTMNVWINDGMAWRLNDTLLSGEVMSLYVVYNATEAGNFTNVITSGNLTANAAVEIIRPEYVIDKIAINKTAVVGQQVLFEIIVKNIGKVAVEGIVISESEIEGLVFDHFIDTMNVWINDGMAWRLNDTLLSGEVMSLYVVYNATEAGNFTNVITSGNLTANATVEIKDAIKPTNPNISIIAIADSPVYIGNTSTIKITVINTGNIDLSDVFVELILNDGLTVVSFDSGLWAYENNRFSYNGILKVGESSTFNVIVNTLTTGNLSSIAYAGFNNTQISNSTFVIEVLNETAPANKTDNNKTDNITDNAQAKVVKGAVGNNSTGNPLILVLLSLMSLLFVNSRRKN